ncbi:hypothetical protein PI125_g18381 [Phytophthora idaei]|nr:hypothetical protein PI125_g18381 [Phytophthora idaei]KAG3125926.1 hypothetical protein PI126_g22554 [Phytophthora idaei]
MGSSQHENGRLLPVVYSIQQKIVCDFRSMKLTRVPVLVPLAIMVATKTG